MPSGFNPDTTPTDVIYDVGVLTYGGGIYLGLTRGGVEFNPNKEYRHPEFDGLRARIAGLDRVVDANAEFTGTLVQFGPELIPYFDPGATGTGTITPGLASVPIAIGSYLDAPTLTYLRAGGGTFSVVFEKGLVTNWSLSGEDKSEAEVEFTIEARLDMDAEDFSTDKIPWTYVVTDA